jgi:lipopolysaccharide export system permease protein
MHRLDLYLIRQIAIACLFIALAVVLVMLFAVSFRLLSLVIDSAATATIFLHLMALTAPTFLPLVLPIALPVAVVFIYNKLSIDSEIVVMRTAGLSPLRLAWPVFFCGGVLAILGMIITMQIAPWANRELVKLQYEVRNNYSSLLIRPNTFNDIATGLTFFTRGRDREGGLEGILIHDTRKPDVTVTVMADRGTIVSSPDGEPKIVVFNGVRQEYDRMQNRLNQLDFENYTFDLSLLAGNVSNRTPDARELGMVAPPLTSALR